MSAIDGMPIADPEDTRVQPLTIRADTTPIGDAVMTLAQIRPLAKMGLPVTVETKPLLAGIFEGIEGVDVVTIDAYSESEDPESLVNPANIYHRNAPHSEMLRGQQRKGHLVEWIGHEYALAEDFLDFEPNLEDVAVELTRDEVEWGLDIINNLREETGRLIAIAAPTSTNLSRDLPVETMLKFMQRTADFVYPVMLTPVHEKYAQHPLLGKLRQVGGNLRQAMSLILASDLFLGVDSGPWHLAWAAVNGCPEEYTELLRGRNRRDKLIAVTGSSSRDAIYYPGTRVIVTDHECKGCGMHGYEDTKFYAEKFGRIVYPSSVAGKGDKSGCFYPSYTLAESSPCMAAVSERALALNAFSVINSYKDKDLNLGHTGQAPEKRS